jgi:hypothetical protein
MDGLTEEIKDIRNSIAYNIILDLEKEGKLSNSK